MPPVPGTTRGSPWWEMRYGVVQPYSNSWGATCPITATLTNRSLFVLIPMSVRLPPPASHLSPRRSGLQPLPRLPHPLRGMVRHLPARFEPPRAARLGPRGDDAAGFLRVVRGGFAFGDEVELRGRAMLIEPVADSAHVCGSRLPQRCAF